MGLPLRLPQLTTRRWLFAVALATTPFYAWYIAHASFELDGHRVFSLFDDAMISMRYARNLAQGAGLRWNAGAAPVEGYSNFLWTLWMAFLQIFPIPQRSVSLGVSVTSACLLISNLWLVRRLVGGAGGREASAGFAVVFCAVSYPLVFWSLRGLEVGFLAFLIDAAVLLAWRAEEAPQARAQWPLALTLSALVLVRDDGVVPASIVFAFLATDARTRTAAKISAVAVIGALLGHLLFRMAYYGAPLPNTYYLKLARIPLLTRVTRGLVVAVRSSVAELSLPLVLTGFAVVARPGDRRVRLLFALVLGQLGSTIFVGGDTWESWGQPDRFLSVELPVLSVAAAIGAEELWAVGGRRRIHSLIFGFVLAWRAYGLAARDFAPKAFTVTPPIDLHRGLSGLSDLAGGLLVGSSLVAAGVLLMARPRRPPAWLAIGLGGIVMVASVGRNWIDFLRDDVTAKQIDWDGHTAAFGIRLGEVLPPTTTVAVVAAGAIPFFSNLPSVDLLGKSDAHIAREEPLERFVPGHDKRDYAYSLSTYKPDLVLELWHHAPEELRAIAAQGYRRLPNGMYVREECPDELLYLIEHGLPEYPYGVHKSK